MNRKSTTVLLTPEQGKKLIANAIAQIPEVKKAVRENTIVVVAGTTNRYLAEALLADIGEKTTLEQFYRGVTVPAGVKLDGTATEDVIIERGKRVRGKTIFDVAKNLRQGDVIFKGANAVNLEERTAAVLVGNPAVGTTLPIIEAVYGRRVKAIIPVGVEKRVPLSISALAEMSTDPKGTGPRLCPLPGEVITEIEALEMLYDVAADVYAAGGVMGAEGAVYFHCSGDAEELRRLTMDMAAL